MQCKLLTVKSALGISGGKDLTEKCLSSVQVNMGERGEYEEECPVQRDNLEGQRHEGDDPIGNLQII